MDRGSSMSEKGEPKTPWGRNLEYLMKPLTHTTVYHTAGLPKRPR